MADRRYIYPAPELRANRGALGERLSFFDAPEYSPIYSDTENAIRYDAGLDPYVGEFAPMLVSTMPGIGDYMDVVEAARSLGNAADNAKAGRLRAALGDMGMATLSSLGIIPLLGGLSVAKKSAKALDMSEAARIARAKEMGFDTRRTWYHGTGSPEDFEAFDVARAGSRGDESHPTAALGIYAADTPEVASGWAQGANARIIPFYSRAENPYVMTNEEFRHRFLEPHGMDARIAADSKGVQRRVDKFKRELSQEGYDSVLIVPEEHTGWPELDRAENLILLDTAKARVPWAKFDTDRIDSADLLASMGGLTLAAKALEEQKQ